MKYKEHDLVYFYEPLIYNRVYSGYIKEVNDNEYVIFELNDVGIPVLAHKVKEEYVSKNKKDVLVLAITLLKEKLAKFNEPKGVYAKLSYSSMKIELEEYENELKAGNFKPIYVFKP